MAVRKKSLLDIARQAGRLSGQIEAERVARRANGSGTYGDLRDSQLLDRDLRVLNALSRYSETIHDKQGTNNGNYDGDARPFATNAQLERKYTTRTYMGNAKG